MNVMPTKKKSAKKRRIPSAKKAVASAPVKASSNGKAKTKSAGPGKFDVKQPPLDGMEDVDERVPALDEECQRYLGFKDAQKTAKVDGDTSAEKIGDLLKEHNLDQYVVNGKKFYIEPGAPAVKCVNVKQNG